MQGKPKEAEKVLVGAEALTKGDPNIRKSRAILAESYQSDGGDPITIIDENSFKIAKDPHRYQDRIDRN